MKKVKLIITAIAILILSSCGPRRYKCGPYRCDIKSNPELLKESTPLNREREV